LPIYAGKVNLSFTDVQKVKRENIYKASLLFKDARFNCKHNVCMHHCNASYIAHAMRQYKIVKLQSIKIQTIRTRKIKTRKTNFNKGLASKNYKILNWKMNAKTIR